jgi:hypothetical protein
VGSNPKIAAHGPKPKVRGSAAQGKAKQSGAATYPSDDRAKSGDLNPTINAADTPVDISLPVDAIDSSIQHLPARLVEGCSSDRVAASPSAARKNSSDLQDTEVATAMAREANHSAISARLPVSAPETTTTTAGVSSLEREFSPDDDSDSVSVADNIDGVGVNVAHQSAALPLASTLGGRILLDGSHSAPSIKAVSVSADARPTAEPQYANSVDRLGKFVATNLSTLPSRENLSAGISTESSSTEGGALVRPAERGKSSDSSASSDNVGSNGKAVSHGDTTSVARERIGAAVSTDDHDFGASFAAPVSRNTTSFQSSKTKPASPLPAATVPAITTAAFAPSLAGIFSILARNESSLAREYSHDRDPNVAVFAGSIAADVSAETHKTAPMPVATEFADRAPQNSTLPESPNAAAVVHVSDSINVAATVTDWATTVVAHPTAAAVSAAMNLRPKAKPQISTSADKSVGAVQGSNDDTTQTLKASEQAFHALLSRENPLESTGVGPSVSGGGADTAAHFINVNSGVEAASQDTTSVARKVIGTSTALGCDHDLGAGFTSVVNAHATSFQPSLPQPAETPISAAAQAAPAAWVPPPVHLAQNTPPASARQPQTGAAPDPPRMVDSGQLRVHENSSELKISVQVPDLGKVEVRAVSVHDVTTAHLTTSQPDALQVLGAERATLEQALKSHGVILGSLDTNGQGQSGEGQRQPAYSSQSQAPSFRGASSAMATAASTSEEAVSGVLQDYSSINVHA